MALFAGGCFWGLEEILRGIPGVVKTEVGYAGGTTRDVTYEEVSTGTTGHAEAVRIVFDPERLSYDELLGYFFRMHDPTTPNRQGNDVGTQYRSAFFYADEDERRIAETVKARVSASGKWKWAGRDRDRAGHEVLAGGGVSPALPGKTPPRLHVPLPAGLSAAGRRPRRGENREQTPGQQG